MADYGCASIVETFLVVIALASDASDGIIVGLLVAAIAELSSKIRYFCWFLGDSKMLEHFLSSLPLVTDLLATLTEPLIVVMALEVGCTAHMVAILALITLNKFVSFCPDIAFLTNSNSRNGLSCQVSDRLRFGLKFLNEVVHLDAKVSCRQGRMNPTQSPHLILQTLFKCYVLLWLSGLPRIDLARSDRFLFDHKNI